jgi:hypothetical protein
LGQYERYVVTGVKQRRQGARGELGSAGKY